MRLEGIEHHFCSHKCRHKRLVEAPQVPGSLGYPVEVFPETPAKVPEEPEMPAEVSEEPEMPVAIVEKPLPPNTQKPLPQDCECAKWAGREPNRHHSVCRWYLK